MVKVESIQKSSSKTKLATFVVAGIIATVAFDFVMYTDIAITGIPAEIPSLLGSLVLGDSEYAKPLGQVIHYGNGVGLSLLFGFVILPTARRIIKIPTIFTAMIFSMIELVVAVWFGLLPALGMGIAGIETAPEIAIVTFSRHIAFGAVLGLYLSRKGDVE